VLDPNGKEVTPIMGCYGIGIERILTAAIEQSNDKNGFWLPASIAPFSVVVTVTNISDSTLREAGEKLAAELDAAGSMCCWMTETSVPASNSKTRIWWAFPTESMSARRLRKAWWNL
jgi:prolyl-tRNA synthetase